MTIGISTLPSSVFTAYLFCQPLWCFAESSVIEQKHGGFFNVWINCASPGAVRFEYTAPRSTESLPGKHTFSHYSASPAGCQQTPGKIYSTGGHRYDLETLRPADHLDHLEKAIKQSRYKQREATGVVFVTGSYQADG